MKNNRVFRLWARPSFFEGVARLLDFGGALNTYNASATEAEADEKAVRSDWETVGLDLFAAMTSVEKSYRARVKPS